MKENVLLSIEAHLVAMTEWKIQLSRRFSESNESLILLRCHSLLRPSYVKFVRVRLSRSVGPTDVPVTPNSSGLVHGSDTGEKRGVAKGKGALCAPHSNYLFRHKSHYQLQLQNWLRPTFTTPSPLRPFDATRTVRTSTCTRVYQTQFKKKKKKNCFNRRETHLAGLSPFRCRYKIVRCESFC